MIESYQKNLLKNSFSWLEILEELSKNTTDTSSLPKLEVSLRSGRMFAGSVIGLKRSVGENLLMLLEYPELNSRARIHLIQCEDIAALSFVDPDVYLSIFSKPIISELELKRKTKTVEDQLDQIVSKRISISLHTDSMSETDRSHVLKLVENIPKIIEQLQKDALGKGLVAEQVDGIEIQMGNAAETRLTDKQLICVFEKDTELFLSKQKEALLESIERVL